MAIKSMLQAVLMTAAAYTLAGQPLSDKPGFATASVKPSGPESRFAMRTSPGTLTMSAVTLKDCIRAAYRVKDFEISGGPTWIDSDKYDVVAKAASSANHDELMVMLQTLLADRFQLVVARGKKAGSVYALTVLKGNARLRPATSGDGDFQVGRGRMKGHGVSMASLAGVLSGVVERPVVDKTGLPGLFDVTVAWSGDTKSPVLSALGEESPATQADGSQAPSIFTALQEQLGLKLAAQSGQVDVLIIESAQRASAN